ncbi:MAG: DUF4157 domain-containing protein [Gemmatimonadota bacterium]
MAKARLVIERLGRTVLGGRIPRPAGFPEGTIPADLVLREGRLVPWIGGMLAGMKGPAAAVTLGRTIIVDPATPLSGRLLAHELVHVRQWERDRLFPLRYALATLRHGYRDNPYEIEAREVEAFAARSLTGEETS